MEYLDNYINESVSSYDQNTISSSIMRTYLDLLGMLYKDRFIMFIKTYFNNKKVIDNDNDALEIAYKYNMMDSVIYIKEMIADYIGVLEIHIKNCEQELCTNIKLQIIDISKRNEEKRNILREKIKNNKTAFNKESISCIKTKEKDNEIDSKSLYNFLNVSLSFINKIRHRIDSEYKDFLYFLLLERLLKMQETFREY